MNKYALIGMSLVIIALIIMIITFFIKLIFIYIPIGLLILGTLLYLYGRFKRQ